MTTVYKAEGVKALQEIIESQPIDRIQGRPDCHTLINLLNQLCAGARQLDCEYSNYGYMWLVLPQNIYFALTAENVVSPIQPPQVPPYNHLGTTTENTLISIQWQKNMELWTTVKNVNAALIAAARSALDQKTQAALTNLFLGTPDRVFLDFYNKLYNKWGKSKPQDVKANDDKMNTPWDPNVNDMSELLNQIRTAFMFAGYIGHPKSDKELVTTGERLIMQTGLFNEQYKMWRRKPDNEREWTHFDAFWTDEYDLHCVPSSPLGLR